MSLAPVSSLAPAYFLLAEVGDKELSLPGYLMPGVLFAGGILWCLRSRSKRVAAVLFFLLLLINGIELDRLRTEFGRAVIDELGVPVILLRFAILNGPLLAGICLHRIAAAEQSGRAKEAADSGN